MPIQSHKIRKLLPSKSSLKTGEDCEMANYEMVDCEMRFIDQSYLDDLVALQEIMAQALPDKEMFKMSSRDCLSKVMDKDRSAIGVLTEDGLIAYHLVRIPGDENNLGVDINLPQSELQKVAHLKAVVVHPSYRGNSLHRRMTAVHLSVLKDWGYEHICCTVSPKNLHSLRNFFSCGMVIKGLKIKYGGLLRYILYRRLGWFDPCGLSGISILSAANIDIYPADIGIRNTDIEGQLDLLRRGYSGYRAEGLPDSFKVIYRQD